MIEGLSEEQLLEVLSSDKFVKGYKTYEKNKDVDKLSNFFDVVLQEILHQYEFESLFLYHNRPQRI